MQVSVDFKGLTTLQGPEWRPSRRSAPYLELPRAVKLR